MFSFALPGNPRAPWLIQPEYPKRRRYNLLVVLLIAGEDQRHARAAACGLLFHYARCLAVGYMWKACCLNPARRGTPKEAGR